MKDDVHAGDLFYIKNGNNITRTQMAMDMGYRQDNTGHELQDWDIT